MPCWKRLGKRPRSSGAALDVFDGEPRGQRSPLPSRTRIDQPPHRWLDGGSPSPHWPGNGRPPDCPFSILSSSLCLDPVPSQQAIPTRRRGTGTAAGKPTFAAEKSLELARCLRRLNRRSTDQTRQPRTPLEPEPTMAIIRPFRGLRPPEELADAVAARPYDVLNSAEARAEARRQ